MIYSPHCGLFLFLFPSEKFLIKAVIVEVKQFATESTLQMDPGHGITFALFVLSQQFGVGMSNG
ncbi:MAG: hypothetical protein CENE_00369 [Candidatus Celerinatantimonas neptuna]|nr:MAG: hypothetical protein CENE_00369 [Candidatus Celerinatantimonas neptuna]